ncbi:MAG: hypothetical protein PHX47_04555 [Candidatus ainarchaeum sp.]|nr:hypothetical protein [Candidatus ainarchaeum sp.]
MQSGNNTQVEDFLKEGIKFENSTLNKHLIELSFEINSLDRLKLFLQKKEFIKRLVSASKEIGYNKVVARFRFGKFKPTKQNQIELLKIQNDYFDELSIQLMGDKFDEFKELIDYSLSSFSKKVSPVIDTNLGVILLKQIFDYLKPLKFENVRWIYHKLTITYSNYKFLNYLIKKDNKKHYLVDCSRRSGLVFKDLNIRDFSTLILLNELFDFDGFCLRHYFPVKNKDGKIIGFSDGHVWKFNQNTFFYERVKSKEFRLNRSREYETMNNLLLKDKLNIPLISKIIKNLEEDYNK